MAKICVIVFTIEGLIMVVFYLLPFTVDPKLAIFVDVAALGIFSTPMVYFFAVRPFVRQADEALARSDALQADLRHSNEELEFQKYALDQHAIVSIADAGGNISYVNDKFCDISGYSREELIGNNHRIIKSDEHPEAFFQDLWREISSGRVWQGDIRNRKKDGRPYWVRTTIVPFTDKQGAPFRYVAIRTEITERKQAEADLREAMEAAEKANQAKSNFLANMSHELRTPLNAIIGFSEFLLAGHFGPMDNPRQEGYIRDIHDSGQHLLALINDVLDVSKIEAGKEELNEQWIEVDSLVQLSVQKIRQQADRKNITLSLEAQEGLPGLWGDERRLVQVFVNLLGNAVKFTDPGGRIIFTVHKESSGNLVFRVKDNGVGIPSEKIAEVVRPFEQIVDSLSTPSEGTGLGLALCSSLLKLHGARMEIESGLGEGTTVSVVFPSERSRGPE